MTQLAAAAAVMNAERIKLTTVRSPLWSIVAAAVLSFGIAALQAAGASDYAPLTAPSAALGVAVFGVPVLMVVAAMTVTGEYRTGMMRTTFMANPDRTLVLAAKSVVVAVFSAVMAAAMVIGAVLVAQVVSHSPAGALTLGTPEVWRTTVAIALYAALAAVLGVGVAAVLRHTAGAVAVLLLWPLLVEPLLANLPGRGAQIGPYLPFANIFRFLDVPWLFPTFVVPWGTWGSLGYFAAIVAAVFVIAVVTVNRRDA